MRTAAILPVKRFARAKQRLAGTVAPPLRAELARAMVEDVLMAVARVEAVERTIVVTAEGSIEEPARALGALMVADEPESSQSAAVSLGVSRALQEGFERVLCVPGDCPTLDPSELGLLLRARGAGGGEGAGGGRGGREVQVVIVPDRHGTGTNGLLLAPPDAITPAFGPDSCARHRRLARDAGVVWRIERLPSLLLDIDTSEDLMTLRKRLAGQTSRAPRTRAMLGLGAAPPSPVSAA
jgi:2-phospho-L-lactate/phosphoenolpyruvate guanylyltransferase